jgi:hypothetical protein
LRWVSVVRQHGPPLVDQRHSGALQVHGRLEPAVDPQVGEPLPDPPRHVQRGGLPDGDDGGGVGLVDDLVHQPVHGVQRGDLLGQPHLQPAHREGLGRHHPAGVRPQRRHQQPVLGVREPVGVREDGGDVHPDGPRRRLVDEPAQRGPLRLLGRESRGVVGLPGRQELPDRVAGDRGRRHAVVAAVEQQDGAPPGREPGRRQQGAQHRVLVVLPADDHPQVDAGPVHQPGHQVQQPLGQPPVADGGLLAQG